MLKFLEADCQKRDRLRSITREKLNELIDKAAADREFVVESDEIESLGLLVENDSLTLFELKHPGESGIILRGDRNRAMLMFFRPPMGEMFLESAPSPEQAIEAGIGEMSVDDLMVLVTKRLNDIEFSIAKIEEMIRQEGPKRRETQRAEAKKLRERLAEFNVLSLMHKVELSLATMGLIANLEHELKAELAKSLKKN